MAIIVEEVPVYINGVFINDEPPCIYQLFERMFRRGYENFSTFLSCRRVCKRLNELAERYTRFEIKNINIIINNSYISLSNGNDVAQIGLKDNKIRKINGIFNDWKQSHYLILMKLLLPKTIDPNHRKLIFSLMNLLKRDKDINHQDRRHINICKKCNKILRCNSTYKYQRLHELDEHYLQECKFECYIKECGKDHSGLRNQYILNGRLGFKRID